MQAQQMFAKTTSAFNSGKTQWHPIKMQVLKTLLTPPVTKISVHNFMKVKKFWFCFGTSEWLGFYVSILVPIK